jgi:hypothetical protein
LPAGAVEDGLGEESEGAEDDDEMMEDLDTDISISFARSA